MADAHPETLLIFDNATVVLEMGREGENHQQNRIHREKTVS